MVQMHRLNGLDVPSAATTACSNDQKLFLGTKLRKGEDKAMLVIKLEYLQFAAFCHKIGLRGREGPNA